MNVGNARLDFWAIVEGRALPPPSARLLNWRFVRLDDAGVLHCAFEATEAFLNPARFVQGGILSAMLDEAMGPVLAATSREPLLAQTLELKTSYFHGARPGMILGEGRVLHRGREIAFLDGRLLDFQQTLIAAASATARVIPALR